MVGFLHKLLGILLPHLFFYPVIFFKCWNKCLDICFMFFNIIHQSWVFIGRTDVEAETPIIWPPDAKSWLIWKDPDAGKDWGQEEKGTTEDEMVGWHHRLNGHGFGWTLGVGDGQGGLRCYSSRGRKESDMTEGLNWTELSATLFIFFPVSAIRNFFS